MRIVARERAEHDELNNVSTLQYEMTLAYSRTLGSASPFFEGLARESLRTTRCTHCSRTFFPPRRLCPDDHLETSWFELPGGGTVRVATRVYGAAPFGGFETPYTLGIIALDGVDGAITHRILTDAVPDAGARVAAVFIGDEQMHPMLRVAFEVRSAS
jgi:uncharacterized OB-fold protein